MKSILLNQLDGEIFHSKKIPIWKNAFVFIDS